MTDATVTPLRRPRAPSGYTDTVALNDIHALLTTGDPGDAALTDIALVLARTGRPMVAARDIEVTTTETALGWPVACAQAGDTSVFICQAPAGTGPAHRDHHQNRCRARRPDHHPRRPHSPPRRPRRR
jgi:hypothetical protein